MTQITKARLAAFALTALILSLAQLIVPIKALVLERFFDGGGWLMVVVFSLYAAWLVAKLLDQARQALWRRRIWLMFSVVFFCQLILGLIGFEKFLMTGELHLPIPALIAAGPIYRGFGLFMPILFGATLILVGPAWCSHLCYIGAWDNVCATSRRRPKRLKAWTKWLRLFILVAVMATALSFNLVGVSVITAIYLAVYFGLLGLVIMLTASRKLGSMVHCTVYCPIGLLADLLGKLSPFRISIEKDCTQCGKCIKVCRYNALSKKDIERRKPALNCTLCGDCLNSCEDRQIDYHFFGLTADQARVLFVVLVVSLHASFLGLARI
jgi:polyferredoxin